MLPANTFIRSLLASVIALMACLYAVVLEAAPKASSSLEAIWENSNLITPQTRTKAAPKLTPLQIQQRRLQSHQQAIKDKQFLQHAKTAIANNPTKKAANKTPPGRTKTVKTQGKTKYTRAQYQARYKNEQELKLNRQRAAWRAKWEAENKTKTSVTQKLASEKLPAQNKRLQPHNQNQNPIKPAQKLTRAQYQQRFKQAQLKKQQAQQAHEQKKLTQVGRTTAPSAARNNTTKIKPTHATFRPGNATPAYRSLPFDIKHKLRAAKLSEYGMSAYVQDVNSGRPLLAHKDTISRVPASVMKLITSYAALGILGPNYRWPLDVFSKGSIQKGTLQGDLIIKGYGSPEFDTAALRKVLHSIRQKGIRNIKGRVVFDNSHFSIPSQYAGAFDGKTFASYNALPDALLYNERISTFQVRTKGKRVHVSTSTPAHNLKIVNRMRKVRRGCRPRIGISHRGAQVVATFSGSFSSRCRTRSYSRVISKPAEMIYGSIKAMWKRDVGGTFNARFAMGNAPANARPLIRTYSRTLAEILPVIDKKSNNVMARQLLLTLGAKHFGGQGTPRKGANAISAWLNSRGLHFPELRIENGSGLSRHARISARHIGDLLVDAYKSPHRNVLMHSLAIAGVDGTMKRRLRGTPVRGRGFFKTGSLRDVRSIAGYVKASDGKTYAIAILHNDPRARRRGLAIHDKLIEWVYNGGREHTKIARR